MAFPTAATWLTEGRPAPRLPPAQSADPGMDIMPLVKAWAVNPLVETCPPLPTRAAARSRISQHRGWARICTMPIPTLEMITIQPVISVQADRKDIGLWALLTTSRWEIPAIALSWARDGVVTSGVWLAPSSPLQLPTDLGQLTRWSGRAWPGPIAPRITAGVPVAAPSVETAILALNQVGWASPRAWRDAGALCNRSNYRADYDELAAWLCGGTVKDLHSWASLRGFSGVLSPKDDIIEALRKSIAMTRLALGVASRCAFEGTLDVEEQPWLTHHFINARGLPIDATLLEQIQQQHPNKIFVEIAANTCTDGRVRGAYHYLGQHTGRWTARKPALHKLRRVSLASNELNNLIHSARAGNAVPGDMLGNLERPIFCAPPGMTFVVGDQKQAEPRAVFYFAGRHDFLEYMETADLYIHPDFQKALFGNVIKEGDPESSNRRTALKVTIIACPYGMGRDTLAAYARENWKFDFAAAGTDPNNAIQAYHNTFPEIRILWANIGLGATTTASNAKKGAPAPLTVGYPWSWSYSQEDLHLHLPSKRTIVYHKVACGSFRSNQEFTYCTGGPLRFTTNKARGGTLFQHLVTGTMRDVHAHHLAELESAGLNPVAHTHDEAVILVPQDRAQEAVATMARIMSTAPAYLPGLRLKCTPYCTERLGAPNLYR